MRTFRLLFILGMMLTLSINAAPSAIAGDDVYGDQLPPGKYQCHPDGAGVPNLQVDPATGNLKWPAAGEIYVWNPANDRYELMVGGQIFWWLFDYNQPGPTDDHFVHGVDTPTGPNVIDSGKVKKTG